MPNFQSGIYRHYRSGNLYFASEVRDDHDTGDIWVSYDALYPRVLRGFTKKLKDFFAIVPNTNNKTVRRFTLVQELPAEAGQMLLPGAKVRKIPFAFVFTVNSVRQKDEKDIYVILDSPTDKKEEAITSNIEDYLKEFESAE